MKVRIYILWLCLCCSSLLIAGPNSSITRVDPPNWWVGMKDTTLQLCVYGRDIAAWKASTNYAGVKITKTSRFTNPNYLWVDISISRKAKPGSMVLVFANEGRTVNYSYELLARSSKEGKYAGFDANDLVYMLMPDRFANGDTTNDINASANETALNRDSMFYRHGGDIQGVIDHLEYVKQTGSTALWLTPMQENDGLFASYHGYATTDHYRVDPRMGTLQLYKELVSKAHTRGIKMIMDVVYNHVGNQHWFYKDIPMDGWVHTFDTFVQTNYRLTSLMDPHASAADKNKMSNGWFVKHMPDLDQDNVFLSRYLIQNSIWWIETSGIDGFRMDTYAYSSLGFMQKLAMAVKAEYPNFGLVGEVWDHAVAFQAALTQQSNIKGQKETNLPGVTDFKLYFAINDALNKRMDWTDGLSAIYYALAQDFLYSHPEDNMVFLDNHDLSRFYSVVGEDIRKYKMGIGFMLTTRGIPCIYYGTEILMKNFADPDGKVREDFSGGWQADKTDKFIAAGRNTQENEAFNYVQKLAEFRKAEPALRTGKLTQFVPEKDTYVYFRSTGKSTIMVVMYTGEKQSQLDLSRFNEMLATYKTGSDVMEDKEIDLKLPLSVEPYSIGIFKLK